MKILLVSNHHGDLPGGAVAMMRTTQQLLESGGHETASFAIREPGNPVSGPRDQFPSVRDLRHQPLPSDDSGASPYSWPARRRLSRLIAHDRPDVAHLHNVFSKLTLSVVDALHAERVPVVVTLHEFKAVCPNGYLFTHDGICHRCLHGARFRNAVRHRCVDGSIYRSAIAAAEAYLNHGRNVWRKIDAFVAPSAFLRDVVVSAGLPGDRVAVVPNPARVTDLGDRGRAEPLFVYSGRLIAQKGLDVLLDATRSIRGGGRVVVYGTGAHEAHLRRRAEDEGLPVDVRGYADEETIARDLDHALATLLPSLWYENCPMTILEAAGRGITAIASDLGGTPELVVDKETGLLVPPGDAPALASRLQQLVDDPTWAQELGRAAWERARARHDPAGHRAALLRVYGNAAARRRRVA